MCEAHESCWMDVSSGSEHNKYYCKKLIIKGKRNINSSIYLGIILSTTSGLYLKVRLVLNPPVAFLGVYQRRS